MEKTDGRRTQVGYHYTVTEEQIREYLQLPVSERLRWLEEAAAFAYRTLSPERWEILQKFRRGEI
ncbi:MAG: hypothetical protein HY033_03880 [Ignavibacteriae bacterium]|nr:hypothetical protein [Ignavibacteria bacterium]MBI3364029.1 hypothetical protein [Ignavibacteriota bacterium]